MIKKRKYTKKNKAYWNEKGATPWESRKLGASAKHVRKSSRKSTEAVDAIIKAAVSPWSSTISEPGLHVRKSPDPTEGDPTYEVVRVVFIDSGHGSCAKITKGAWDGGCPLSPYEISQSQFQRIEE